MLGQVVESVDDGVVVLTDGTQIGATTVVWAAGVRACGLARRLDVPVAQSGRVPVTPELNLKARPEVFVIGDMAFLEGHQGAGAYRMAAQVAMQQGRQAARNITALERECPPRAFRYFNKGRMATIGRRCVRGWIRPSPARLARVDRLAGAAAQQREHPGGGLHLGYLRGVTNRLVVLSTGSPCTPHAHA